MYGIFTYIWVIFRASIGKYSIHGAYGYIYIYKHIHTYYIPFLCATKFNINIP